MLKYLVVLLDDTSVAFCHYCSKPERKLISPGLLKEAVRFAMLENLNVQFVWPDYDLPDEYRKIISSISHVNIVPVSRAEEADIQVGEAADFENCRVSETAVVRLDIKEFVENPAILFPPLEKCNRVNVVFNDIAGFKDEDADAFGFALKMVTDKVIEEVISGRDLQLNILTDRLMLSEMNNCNAGYESITLAPDGKFYICPAFYYGGQSSVGTVEEGLHVPNQQLYDLEHAPICRNCEAWHCRRCVWLNKQATLEVNTPGHEQCVVSHIERNASRQLLTELKMRGKSVDASEIGEIDYLDPFDKIRLL